MTLTGRLVISYTVIILVTLILAFITLIIVARPLQNRLAGVRLAAQTRQAARQINSLYREGISTEQILRRLAGRASVEEVHLVFADPQGTVLADNQNEWLGQQLDIFGRNASPTSPASLSGSFNDPAGQPFIYAAAPVGPASQIKGYVVAATPRAPVIPRLITEMGWGFGLAGLVALLISLLLGVVIARSIALPLQRIAGAAAAVAAGDYSQRLPETGPPEIKRVTASFNVMAGQVQAGQQAMRDFVSNVSHELKTPLTSIQGFSQAIMEGATQDETARRRAAGIIYQEAARLTRLVEDLLDLVRLDSGQVIMHKAPLDLNQILSNTVDRLLPQAVEKKIQLFKNWEALPSTTIGDGDRLAQVFTNLLDNAIRHTPAGGRITIKGAVATNIPLIHQAPTDTATASSKQGDFAEVSIADTGPGIPPDDLARIFERFYQVDKSRRRGRGTGLGLAIVKEIIEAHHGYVRVESVEGVGTKFTILLPVSQADYQLPTTPAKSSGRSRSKATLGD